MQNVAEAQETPISSLAVAPVGAGVCWTDHAVPFHASASVTLTLARFVRNPTAAHALGEVQETAFIAPSLIGGLGVCWTVHAGGWAWAWAGRAAAAAVGAARLARTSAAAAIPAVAAANATETGLRAGARRAVARESWLVM
jgi:hypothetical protein